MRKQWLMGLALSLVLLAGCSTSRSEEHTSELQSHKLIS